MSNLRWCLIVDEIEIGRFCDIQYAKAYIHNAIKIAPDNIVLLDLNIETKSKEIYKLLTGDDLELL